MQHQMTPETRIHYLSNRAEKARAEAVSCGNAAEPFAASLYALFATCLDAKASQIQAKHMTRTKPNGISI